MPTLTHLTRQKLRHKSIIALTIVCLPCICIVGTCFILSHYVFSLSTYESPSTRRKRQREYEERENRRRIPWVLAPRIGEDEVLSIGNENVAIPGLGSKIRKSDEKRSNKSEDIPWLSSRSGKAKREKQTIWQNASPFFNLPLELRRQIYEEAIAGYTLHIFTLDAYRRMAHTRCKTASLPLDSAPCQCTFLSRQPGVADEWGNVSLLALLMSCRRIYSEAIEILYSKNTFAFSSMAPLISHILNIPPQRVAVMRDVKWNRMFIGATVWSTTMPWLECRRRKGTVEAAGCACFMCWPKQTRTDTRVRTPLSLS
ncbi:hypothetical protein N431DRAFT_358358 [Stipitochalara longipes BDJ]|nr:hypothetical protein N431DRAFT_358358 [Stipitochalara longipes BDJ]